MAIAIVAGAGCTPLAREEPRLSRSTLGCIHEVMREKYPVGLTDRQAHCVAAGLIARHCSVTEAMLASVGKEIQDLFGAGHAQWSDLRADRHGIRCARNTDGERAFFECCETSATRF